MLLVTFTCISSTKDTKGSKFLFCRLASLDGFALVTLVALVTFLTPRFARRRGRLPKGAAQVPEGRPLIGWGREPPGRRRGWKFSARKRGMYRRRPRRRLWKRAKPAPAPRERRDRIPPSEARRRKIPATGPEVLRAEAREVPTASPPTSPPLGRKFSARKRGMYRRHPRHRLWKRAEPAPAPRQRL